MTNVALTMMWHEALRLAGYVIRRDCDLADLCEREYLVGNPPPWRAINAAMGSTPD